MATSLSQPDQETTFPIRNAAPSPTHERAFVVGRGSDPIFDADTPANATQTNATATWASTPVQVLIGGEEGGPNSLQTELQAEQPQSPSLAGHAAPQSGYVLGDTESRTVTPIAPDTNLADYFNTSAPGVGPLEDPLSMVAANGNPLTAAQAVDPVGKVQSAEDIAGVMQTLADPENGGANDNIASSFEDLALGASMDPGRANAGLDATQTGVSAESSPAAGGTSQAVLDAVPAEPNPFEFTSDVNAAVAADSISDTVNGAEQEVLAAMTGTPSETTETEKDVEPLATAAPVAEVGQEAEIAANKRVELLDERAEGPVDAVLAGAVKALEEHAGGAADAVVPNNEVNALPAATEEITMAERERLDSVLSPNEEGISSMERQDRLRLEPLSSVLHSFIRIDSGIVPDNGESLSMAAAFELMMSDQVYDQLLEEAFADRQPAVWRSETKKSRELNDVEARLDNAVELALQVVEHLGNAVQVFYGPIPTDATANYQPAPADFRLITKGLTREAFEVQNSTRYAGFLNCLQALCELSQFDYAAITEKSKEALFRAYNLQMLGMHKADTIRVLNADLFT